MTKDNDVNTGLKDKKLIDVEALYRLRDAARERGPLTDAELERQAREDYGFTTVAPLKTEKLRLRADVRAMCTPDKCRMCGHTWTCPPGCGPLEEIDPKIRRFRRGLLLVHVADLADERDYATMRRTGEIHKDAVMRFYANVLGTYPDAVALSAGSCSFCRDCTYPDDPCRYPEFAYPSLEACGMMVSDVCEACGVPFYTGKNNKMTFCSGILLD